MNGLLVRPYREGDAPALAQLFHRAVHHGAARRYSTRQRRAWSPAPPEGMLWEARLALPDTFVAERDGTALGFMTLDIATGYLDFAYVAPEVMGQGVAETLYVMLEGRARLAGLDRLETEASRLSQRFFRRRGWRVIARQKVERNGVKIPNARMEKMLSAAPAERAA